MSTPRIVVAHGYNANPERNWFPWLVEQYGAERVTVPAQTAPTEPRLEPWIDRIAAAIGGGGPDTIVIGHSLGCVTALRALARLERPWTLAGLILVAGFVDPLPGWPKLDEFVDEPIDVAPLIASIPRRTVFISDDDPGVPLELTRRLAQLLEAELITVPGAGHFSDATGFVEFPELVPVIERMSGGVE